MKEIILCLVFISSGMLFAAKKIVVEQLPEANRHLAEVETNVAFNVGSPSENKCGWNERNTRGLSPVAFEFFREARHAVIIEETGRVTLRKIDNEVSREVNGSVYLNGQKKE